LKNQFWIARKKLILSLVLIIFNNNAVSSEWHEDPAIYSKNSSYVIENLEKEQGEVAFDLWNHSPARAIIEIYDAEGKRVSYRAAAGDKLNATLEDDMKDSIGSLTDLGKVVIGEKSIFDPRMKGSSKKTNITFSIPEGGSFKVTKSGNLAFYVNLAHIVLNGLKQVGMPDDFSGSVAVDALMEGFIKSSLIGTPETLLANEGLDVDFLLKSALDVGIGVMKNVGGDIVEKWATTILKTSVTPYLAIAEKGAYVLQTNTIFVDLKRHMNNTNDLYAYEQELSASLNNDDVEENRNIKNEIVSKPDLNILKLPYEQDQPWKTDGTTGEVSISDTKKDQGSDVDDLNSLPATSAGSLKKPDFLEFDYKNIRPSEYKEELLQVYTEVVEKDTTRYPASSTTVIEPESSDDINNGNKVIISENNEGDIEVAKNSPSDSSSDLTPKTESAEGILVNTKHLDVGYPLATVNRSMLADAIGTYQYTAIITPWPNNYFVGAMENATNIPRQGTGVYRGELIGDYLDNQGAVNRGVMTGDITLQLDFAQLGLGASDQTNNVITGSLNISKNGSFYSYAEFRAGSSQRSTYGNEFGDFIFPGFFNTGLTITRGKGVRGRLNGYVFGEGGTEIGGGWEIQEQLFGEEPVGASGVYRAKQSSDTPSHQPFWSGYYSQISIVGVTPTISFVRSTFNTADTGFFKPKGGVTLSLTDTLKLSSSGVGFYLPKSMTLTGSEFEYFDDYSNIDGYSNVAWGQWVRSNNDPSSYYHSKWVVVDVVDKNQIPQQGSADYTGELRGALWLNAQGNTVQRANGNISLNANFKSMNLSGNMTVNNANTNARVATAVFNTNMATSSDGGNLHFTGQLTGDGISAPSSFINGQFGGDQAAEVGGNWKISKNVHSGTLNAAGVFRARSDISTPPVIDEWRGFVSTNLYTENSAGDISLLNSGVSTNFQTRTLQKPASGVTLRIEENSIRERRINLTATESEYSGDYSYISWGNWSDSSPSDPRHAKAYDSHWVLGEWNQSLQKWKTDIPQHGTAIYKGDVRGTIATFGQVNSFHAANGNITLNANFANNNIAGNMIVNNADTNTEFANTSFNANINTSAGSFKGPLTGQGITASTIKGFFGGAQAAEVGGDWLVSKGSGNQNNGDSLATGVFRAKKQ